MYNTVNMSFTAPWTQVQTWAQQQGQKIETSLASLETEREEVQRLLDWISSAEEALSLRDQEPPAETTEQIQELIEQHTVRLFLLLWPFSLIHHLASLSNGDFTYAVMISISPSYVGVVLYNLLCELHVCSSQQLCLLSVAGLSVFSSVSDGISGMFLCFSPADVFL